jgi:hypothetical protein
MGKGLLAWWRRRIVARGLAGAALFAVPVAVAALIGFGTGFSGVAGGLSSVTNGPDAVPAAAQTGPSKLNRAVVALANRPAGSNGSASGNDAGGGSSGGSSGTTDGTGTESGTGTDTGTGTSGSGSGTQVPTVSTPSVPQVDLPGTGSGGAVGDTTDALNGTVNNVLGGVNNTLNGLLGK